MENYHTVFSAKTECSSVGKSIVVSKNFLPPEQLEYGYRDQGRLLEMPPRRGIEKILSPFHKTKSIVDSLSITGISNAEKELLLTLMVKGKVVLSYSYLPKLISSTLGTPMRSKSTIHDAVRKLKEKGYVKVLDGDRYLALTTKGLVVAGKYVVLARMMYTVPMTITLLLLLTILRPWTPWWFLGAATIIAILHHASNLTVLFMKPIEQDLGLLNKPIRIIPELLPIILVVRSIVGGLTSMPKKLKLKYKSRKIVLSTHYVENSLLILEHAGLNSSLNS